MPCTPQETLRIKVQALLDLGMPVPEICAKLGLGRSTAYKMVKNLIIRGTAVRKQGSGPRFSLDSSEVDEIEENSRANNRKSCSKLAAELQEDKQKAVSQWTISRALRSKGLFSRSPAKRPSLSPKNIQDRCNSVNQWIYWPKKKFQNIIFSDECRFKLSGSDGAQKVRRSVGSRYEESNLNFTKKFGAGSIMVWGCMSYGGLGNLVIVEETMNSVGYVRLLAENLHESADKMGLGDDFVFQQDNAPCHKARHTLNFFERNNIDVLEWPAQSPDLSPIEHVWALIKKRLGRYSYKTKRELVSRIMELWSQITREEVRNLIDSVPRRVEACFLAKGRNTRY